MKATVTSSFRIDGKQLAPALALVLALIVACDAAAQHSRPAAPDTRSPAASGPNETAPDWYDHLGHSLLRVHLPESLLRPGPKELLWWQSSEQQAAGVERTTTG